MNLLTIEGAKSDSCASRRFALRNAQATIRPDARAVNTPTAIAQSWIGTTVYSRLCRTYDREKQTQPCAVCRGERHPRSRQPTAMHVRARTAAANRPTGLSAPALAKHTQLEAAEYLTRQSIAGAEWARRTRGATLLLDYFPLGDETDHLMYGIVAPDGPMHDTAITNAVVRVRARARQLVDRRLAELQALVEGDRGAMLLVSGDHGMRATWRVFRPNVTLAEAGLLTTDTSGVPMLSRTEALSPNGYFISINSTTHRGGIVPLDSAGQVVAAVIRALRAVRDADGEPVVIGAWTAAQLDSLGAGGAAGGDVYFELARGYRSSWDARGAVTAPASVDAGHGFLSTAADMRTVFCAYGDAFLARRTSPARTIDAAPTVAEWIGIRAPSDARGRSRLGDLLPR
jgi:hypothetical protein